jgi:molybdopterin-guanine dinucleotide biosynthesis protein A
LSLPQPAEAQDAAGFVLAGGQSSRMGQDKALLEFAGGPLIVRALTILRKAGLPTAIAGARSALSTFAPVIEDPTDTPGMGPLSGICAALSATTVRYAVFLTVDQPFMPSSLITCLLAHARFTESLIAIASVSGSPQTFPAVIDRKTLHFLEGRLRSRERGCLNAFQLAANDHGKRLSILPAELLVQSGRISDPASLPPAFWFLNLNTPQDFVRAEKLSTGHLRVS